MTTITTVTTEVTTSFTSSATEPVTSQRRGREWRALSTFATTRRRLNSAKSALAQNGSKVTRASERPMGIVKTIRVILGRRKSS